MAKESASKGAKSPRRIGKYELLKHIATGGMGSVFKAIDTDLNRTVALKILADELAAKPAMVVRFKREGRSAARLRHENIVGIYECDEYKGTHFLALEYIEGRDLHDHIRKKGKLGVEEARLIMIQAAKALDHAHRNNVVHRDIKPANFLITKNEAGQLLVKLTDLGLARRLDDDEARVTKPETTIGTVDYMSPEQAQNSGTADIRSDIYSLGCTYYHMLSGQPPFPTGSLIDRIIKHRDSEPQDICELNSAVPYTTVRILRRMTAKKPEDRYQTPQELLADLQNTDTYQDSLLEHEPELRPLDAPSGGSNTLSESEPALRPLDTSFSESPPTASPPAGLQPPNPPPTAPPKKGPGPVRAPIRGVALPAVGSGRSDKERTAHRATTLSGKKKRSREELRELAKSRRKKGRLPTWWPWAVGGAGADPGRDYHRTRGGPAFILRQWRGQDEPRSRCFY